MIVNNNNLALSDKEDFSKFSEFYAGWLGKIYSNIFSVTGHVSKLDWLPD